MIRIGIHGASGKMGYEIISNLKNNEQAVLSVAYTIEPMPFDVGDAIVTNDFKTLFDNSDVIIDFSIKDGAVNLINYARTNPKPLIIGTTGLGSEGDELIKLASSVMPILQATNMSLGVAVLNRLTELASRVLDGFDIEIVEMHHRRKVDAPSGTALTLATHAAKARNLTLDSVRVSGRDGMIGARSKDEIAVMSLRGGDIVGRHTVGFYNDGEFIELNHTATSRATFAKGAIKAAIWIKSKEPKLYSIYDCLGL
ncbi:4-hydroxy-tetrahydrodipicolinate reductase [Campylobacter fetus]|uniref:4-hydroxy-tetrahydrodipicolinate reductase n=1 Tax=Campylobacter fetus TaxID=196 RepID=UPI000FCB5D34|nr:4-hydroxy-tetrahydrodipicolinate reductase [Campylobacter fetus]QQF53035.1 4-hydroxy-tetrahydrodipicolinate reductase [Campylobacter fetus subsp. venerealis]RUT49882.1 4-hydroxy-tetrahydrodipicolinate reductase [Campylobacter fetus]RUT50143.1 4-hydroxy-tetrahydrodipicolinate reductase [Campylobacter fetus]